MQIFFFRFFPPIFPAENSQISLPPQGEEDLDAGLFMCHEDAVLVVSTQCSPHFQETACLFLKD